METSNETVTMGNTLKYIVFDFWDEYGEPDAKGNYQEAIADINLSI